MSSKTTNGASHRILIASRSFGPNCPEALERLRSHGCELVSPFEKKPSEDELIATAPNFDAIVSGTERLSARVLDACPNLKVISKHGVGIENIDVAHAKRRGVVVAVTTGAINESVADHTWALLLSLARRVVRSHNDIMAGGWKRYVGVELAGKTLGIIGFGQIGKAVCRRAAGFGVSVIAYDVFRDEAFAREWNVRYVSREDLIAISDIVSLHCNVTAENRGMVNPEFLGGMKRTALLINASRGELVDEAALAAALRNGTIAGAATDVFATEPPKDSPLLGAPNFIATAHLAGQTEEGLRKMGEIAAENALRVLQGQPPLFQV